MRIALTGSSGLVGTALSDVLASDGHEVVRLVRREPRAYDEVRWDPATGSLDPRLLGPVDAAVNLAGAGVGNRRWTSSYKQVVKQSRVDVTTTLSNALADLDPRPLVLLSASGVDYYGDALARGVDESGGPGDTFLACLCREWETATAPAEQAGIRVCHLRLSVVLSGRGGVLGAMLPLFRLGLGGRLGPGTQYWSWIALADVVRAVRFLLRRDDLAGPVNVTSPAPATNAELTRALGVALHRPTPFPVPSLALRTVLGEYTDQMLASKRAIPRRLLGAGFEFRYPDVQGALEAAVRGY